MRRPDADEERLLKVTHSNDPNQSITVNAVNKAELNQLILSGNKPIVKRFVAGWHMNSFPPYAAAVTTRWLKRLKSKPAILPKLSRRDLLNLAMEAQRSRPGETRVAVSRCKAREARRMQNGSPPLSVAGWRPG